MEGVLVLLAGRFEYLTGSGLCGMAAEGLFFGDYYGDLGRTLDLTKAAHVLGLTVAGRDCD